MTNRVISRLCSASAGCAGILIALASAAVPAHAIDITSCGYTITAPGNYDVRANLTTSSGQTCIFVEASNVSLKLNGFSITGSGSQIGISVIPNSGRLNHVAITGPGLINGWATGIAFSSTDYSQVGQVTAAGNAVGVSTFASTFLTIGSNVLVRNLVWGAVLQATTNSTIQSNETNGNGSGSGGAPSGGIGLVASSSFNTINNNTASANTGSAGIYMDSPSGGNRVYGNSTDGNTGAGIQVLSRSNQIFSNTSSVGNGTFDLEDDNSACDSNLWSNNVFFTASQTCIH